MLGAVDDAVLVDGGDDVDPVDVGESDDIVPVLDGDDALPGEVVPVLPVVTVSIESDAHGAADTRA